MTDRSVTAILLNYTLGRFYIMKVSKDIGIELARTVNQ